MTTNTEVWKPVTGFEGFYEVSSLGRVRSWKKSGPGTSRANKPKILACSGHPDGYKVLQMHGPNGTIRAEYVHRLVAEHFLGEIPAGYLVCHRNGDPTDNRASNLRIDTAVSNSADKVKHGTVIQGESHPRAKVTEIDVKQLRMIWDTGILTLSEASESLGVNRSTVREILSGNTWKHVATPF